MPAKTTLTRRWGLSFPRNKWLLTSDAMILPSIPIDFLDNKFQFHFTLELRPSYVRSHQCVEFFEIGFWKRVCLKTVELLWEKIALLQISCWSVLMTRPIKAVYISFSLCFALLLTDWHMYVEAIGYRYVHMQLTITRYFNFILNWRHISNDIKWLPA
jgi:hypothetical protein